MKKIIYLFLWFLFAFCLSCTTNKEAFNPNKKYSPEILQQDYSLFRNILEESHPALYWYTPKDSIDYFFNKGYTQLKDSMTEPQFRNLLTYVATKIDCGHTSVRHSK